MSELVTYRATPKPAPSMLARAKAALQAVRAVWSGPYSLKDPALSRLFGAGYENYAGIQVTETNAMTFSAVFSAVLQISSDVAKLPLNLHKRRQEGGSDHYIDARLYHLLKNEPNPETSSMMFRQTITAHALTCHGGYAEIERDMHGRPKALWTLTPDRVEPIRREQYDRATGRKGLGPLEYRIDNDDDQILPMRDVLHISGLGYDGVTGYSVIHKARQAIGLALAMEKFGGQYFRTGGSFGGWLESEDDLDPDQKKEIRDEIEKFRKEATRILVTGAGQKYHQLATKPAESQMDESRTAQILEVARFFRMPPVKLGVNTPGTVSYASSEQADLDYYKGPMLDWIIREEQEFNRKLIPASERRQQFIKHNATAFLRADTAGRTSFYKTMMSEGVFCADDVLELEDMNPQPNGQGKVYLVQGAMIPKDQLVTLTDAKIDLLKRKTSEPAPAVPAPGGGGDPAGEGGDDDDQARAIGTLGEQLAQVLAAVSGLSGEQRAQLEQLRDELETVRIDKATADAAVASVTGTCERLTTERDAAVARATEAETAAAAATTDRDAMGAAAAQARAEASGLSLAAAESEAARQAAVADQTAAGERLADLQGRVDTLVGELEAARAELATAAEASAAAARQASAHAEVLAARNDALTEIGGERDRAAAAAEALRQQLADAETVHATTLSQHDREIEGVRTELATAQTLLGQTDQERTARIAELTGEVECLAADLAQREREAAATAIQQLAERTALASAVVAAEEAQAGLQARVAELEAQVTSATAAAAQAQQHLEGERAARIERMTAMIAAHRGLFVDAIGRMARREVQQARAKQATPEKLRRWLDGFMTAEAPICVEALLPAMRVRLAWRAGETKCADCGHPAHAGARCTWEVAMGADCQCDMTDRSDPVKATVAIVTEHMQAFEALVRGVIDAPPEDFHAELERVLARWEAERAERVADALLEREIRHVRSL